MIVRQVTERYPQTMKVFGEHKLDFIDALLADLDRAIEQTH
jgi:hypothetical protein